MRTPGPACVRPRLYLDLGHQELANGVLKGQEIVGEDGVVRVRYFYDAHVMAYTHHFGGCSVFDQIGIRAAHYQRRRRYGLPHSP